MELAAHLTVSDYRRPVKCPYICNIANALPAFKGGNFEKGTEEEREGGR